MTAIGNLALGIEVEFLEFSVFPCTRSNHINCEISLHLLSLWSKVGSLGNSIALVSNNIDQLALLHLINDLFVMSLQVRVLVIL